MDESRQTGKRLFAIVLIAVTCGHSPNVLVAADGRSASTAVQPVELSEEANEFFRGMLLLLIPEEYVDEDDWGSQRRVQSGLKVKLDGVKLHTSRRWKQVNHGLWKRTELRLHQPEEKFQLRIEFLPQENEDLSRYRLHATARIRIHGRQQRWANGVKLYSASGDATADVTLRSDITLQRSFVDSEGTKRLRILPQVDSLVFVVNGFRLQRVGHAKGAIVREFGRSLRSVINRLISHRNPRMVRKINQRIQKKPERFEIPLGILSLLVGSSEGTTPEEN